jgi:NitT/TauT family transport system substrate-binding protein
MKMQTPALSRRAFVASALVGAAIRPTMLLAQDAPIKIGVGSDPVFSSFYLAAHEKMFEAEKLNVEVHIYQDGGEAMNALVAQQINLAPAS